MGRTRPEIVNEVNIVNKVPLPSSSKGIPMILTTLKILALILGSLCTLAAIAVGVCAVVAVVVGCGDEDPQDELRDRECEQMAEKMCLDAEA
jgi:hypothetical protein